MKTKSARGLAAITLVAAILAGCSSSPADRSTNDLLTHPKAFAAAVAYCGPGATGSERSSDGCMRLVDTTTQMRDQWSELGAAGFAAYRALFPLKPGPRSTVPIPLHVAAGPNQHMIASASVVPATSLLTVTFSKDALPCYAGKTVVLQGYIALLGFGWRPVPAGTGVDPAYQGPGFD